MKSNKILELYSDEINELSKNMSTTMLYIGIHTYSTTLVEDLEYPYDNDEINFLDIKFIPEHELYKPLNPIVFENNLSLSYDIIWLNPITVLKSLGKDNAFNLRKSRYTKVCSYLSKGKIIIPEVSIDKDDNIVLIDGRHRICAVLANCGLFEKFPFIINKEKYNSKFDLGIPNDIDIKSISDKSITISYK